MTSDRKIKANRANARASTGPRTVDGRTRSARNALRHGLSLPVCSDPALCEEVEALARDIAGTDAKKRRSICGGCVTHAISFCPMRWAIVTMSLEEPRLRN